MRIISKIVFITSLLSILSAQDTAQDVSDMRVKIQTIEKEISALEKKIKTADNRLKVESKSITHIDKQISLTHEKVNLYRDKINDRKQVISILEIKIDSLQQEINSLQEIFKQQVVFAYKYQRGQQYDWLLGAESFNEIFIRYSYLKRVLNVEKSVYEELHKTQSEQKSKGDQLIDEIKSTETLLASAKKAEVNLSQKRNTKSELIRKIKQNKTVLTQSLDEKKKSYQELLKILSALEKGRPTRKLSVETKVKWERLTGSFAKNMGRFNWPVQGKLLHGFGRYQNPELKTVLNNPGIDIEAARGTDVRCIFSGVVSMITYMGGFGNTLIIDHNDGYYTVYAHLDQILVNTDDFVEGGTIVGTVGESGFLEGSQLHFEIYGNNKNLNPLRWLKKR